MKAEWKAPASTVILTGGADALAIGRAFQPFSDLCPAQHAVDAMRSIGLAHFAANLSNSNDARALLADLAGTLSQRGIELELDGVKHFG